MILEHSFSATETTKFRSMEIHPGTKQRKGRLVHLTVGTGKLGDIEVYYLLQKQIFLSRRPTTKPYFKYPTCSNSVKWGS